MSDQTRGAEPPKPTGPSLSYDVPQEVSYSGQSFIELQLPPDFFIATSLGQSKGD